MSEQRRQPWYAAPLHVVLDLLVTTEHGLPTDEAERRLHLVGPNRVSASQVLPTRTLLGRQLCSLPVGILLAAAATALIAGYRLEAAVIGVVVVLNALVGFAAEFGSRRVVAAYLRHRHLQAVVLRDGRRTRVDATEVVPGDVVEVTQGQRVPADGRLLSAAKLQVDEHRLTGVPTPVEKTANPAPPEGTPLRERSSMLYAGTTVVQGSARAVVLATGASTASARLGRFDEALERRTTPLATRAARLGRRMTWIALAGSALAVALGVLRGRALEEMLETGIALAVAAVPVALTAVTTIVLAVALRRMARKRVILKHPGVVEALGSATLICADLVETFTAAPPRATRVVTPSARARLTGGDGGAPGRLEVEPRTPEAEVEVERVLRAAGLSLGPRSDDRGLPQDPGSATLQPLFRAAGMMPDALLQDAPRFAEIPYDPTHRMGASFHREATGTSAVVWGAADAVLARCGSRASGAPASHRLDLAERARIDADVQCLAGEGCRVLAFARHPTAARTEDLRDPFVYLGLIGMETPLALDVAETVEVLRNAGIQTAILTDEDGVTGTALARKAGISIDGVSEGAKVPGARRSTGDPARGTVALFGRLGNEARGRLVQALRSRGEVVVAAGGGGLGPGALDCADVAVVPGLLATEVDRSAADVVLGQGRFPAVLDAVREGRVAFDNLRRSIAYLFACSVSEVLVLAIAAAAGWPLPLLPLQLLWLNLATDALPALSLAAEPGESDVLRRPPRDARAGLLDRSEIGTLTGFGVLMAGVTLVAFLVALRTRPAEHAITVAFTTVALTQLFHLANVRNRDPAGESGGTLPNPWMTGAALVGLVLQLVAVYWGPVSGALRTVPLGISDWTLVLILAAVPAVVGRVARSRVLTIPWRRRSETPGAAPRPSTATAVPAAHRLLSGQNGNGLAGPTPHVEAVDEARAAVEAGDVEALRRLLLAHPGLVHARDDGGTLLHHATGMPTLSWPPEAPDIVTLLVESGADPDAGEEPDGSGETPLIHAVSVNNVAVAQRLLDLGADPERHGRHAEQGFDTALGYALFYGQDPRLSHENGDCVEMLVERGAQVSLPLAAALGRLPTVETGLAGASPEVARCALVFAAHRGQVAVVRACLRRGVDPSIPAAFFHERLTPLHAAAGQGHLETVRALLDAGADRSVPDGRFGTTPVGWAWHQGHKSVVALLGGA